MSLFLSFPGDTWKACRGEFIFLLIYHILYVNIWLIVAQSLHLMTLIWVNIGSGNGLLPDGTKPFPDSVLTYHERYSLALSFDQIHKKVLICEMGLKNTLVKLFLPLSGANELLTHLPLVPHICVGELGHHWFR